MKKTILLTVISALILTSCNGNADSTETSVDSTTASTSITDVPDISVPVNTNIRINLENVRIDGEMLIGTYDGKEVSLDISECSFVEIPAEEGVSERIINNAFGYPVSAAVTCDKDMTKALYCDVVSENTTGIKRYEFVYPQSCYYNICTAKYYDEVFEIDFSYYDARILPTSMTLPMAVDTEPDCSISGHRLNGTNYIIPCFFGVFKGVGDYGRIYGVDTDTSKDHILEITEIGDNSIKTVMPDSGVEYTLTPSIVHGFDGEPAVGDKIAIKLESVEQTELGWCIIRKAEQ